MVGQSEPTPDLYLKDAHDRLDEWESRVKRLEREVEEARQLKSAMQKPVEQRVEPQLAAFRSRIQELATADPDNREFMRERVEAAEAELATAYEAVAAEFDVQ